MASKLPPPVLLIFVELFFFEIVINTAESNIAKNKKKAAEILNKIKPESLKVLENLFEISEPKRAPKDPPAIIIP